MCQTALHIREFTQQDSDAYLSMATAFYHSGAVSQPIPESHFLRTFALCMEHSPYVRGLLLEYEGAPAGFALLALTHSNEAGGLVVWLEELYVLPKHRGKGFGKALFAFVEAEYMDTAVRYRLEVAKTNEGAIRMYRALGYEEMPYLPMVKDVAEA